MIIRPVKLATERLQIGKLDDYAGQMINEIAPEIYARTYHYNSMRIAQKGNLLLFNSGAKTSVLDLKKMKDKNDILYTAMDNFHDNSKLNVTGRPITYSEGKDTNFPKSICAVWKQMKDTLVGIYKDTVSELK